MAGILFEDIFDVKDIDPDGKKFDRGKELWVQLTRASLTQICVIMSWNVKKNKCDQSCNPVSFPRHTVCLFSLGFFLQCHVFTVRASHLKWTWSWMWTLRFTLSTSVSKYTQMCNTLKNRKRTTLDYTIALLSLQDHGAVHKIHSYTICTGHTTVHYKALLYTQLHYRGSRIREQYTHGYTISTAVFNTHSCTQDTHTHSCVQYKQLYTVHTITHLSFQGMHTATQYAIIHLE